MTKKQAAMKKTGKGATMSPILPKSPMTTRESQHYWRMDFIAERGFKTEKAPEAFTKAVAALGWENFIKHRKEYITSVVREFYIKSFSLLGSMKQWGHCLVLVWGRTLLC